MRIFRGARTVRRGAILAEAIVALLLARSALRVLPFRWLVSDGIEPAPHYGGAGIAPGAPDPRAVGVGAAIAFAAARLPWHSTCLVRALAARLMLVRRGVPTVLCLGVAKNADALRAHAWLMAGDGAVCGGPESPDYTVIAALPAARDVWVQAS